MRVKTYKEAVVLARCAGEDAANRRMRKAGRTEWSAADFDHAASITESTLVKLGFDVVRWTAMAGVPRNEPDEPKVAKKSKSKRRPTAVPVQLTFAFS